MSVTMKMFAEYILDNGPDRDPFQIEREVMSFRGAVIAGNEIGAKIFHTYEVPGTVVDGKKLTGEKENLSKRHYLNQDRVYTPAEVIAQTETSRAKGASALREVFDLARRHEVSQPFAEKLGKMEKDVNERLELIAQARKDGPDTRYVWMESTGFIRVEDGETVWDRDARQLWPRQITAMRPQASMAR